MKKISIGIPCYNEEENIELMYHAIKKIMDDYVSMGKYDYEILFEDNCSVDNSEKILREISQNDTRVKVILNQTNCGPLRSGTNCMKNISGDAYISIPCDFQEPPEMIPKFIKIWEQGNPIVWGQKVKSKESNIKYFLRNIYYGVIDVFSDDKQLKQVTGFGIMDRTVVDAILPTKIQDPEIAVRHLVVKLGYDVVLIPYEQQERKRGSSSYNLSKYYNFAITSLCNTSIKPLRLMTLIGMITGCVSMIIAVVYFVYKLVNWNGFSLGVGPIVIGMFFIGSVQLFCLGILGEYVGVLLRKVTNEALVIEKERINFEVHGAEKQSDHLE